VDEKLAIENSHAIASTPGVNALMLGPGDLRVSLGLPCRNPPGQGEHPKFLAAVSKMVAAAKSCDIPLMAPAFRMDPSATAWMRDFKLLLTGVDLLSMVKSYRQDLSNIKEALSGNENKSSKSNGIRHDQPNGTESDQNGAHIYNGRAPNGLSVATNGENGAIMGAHRLAITHGNVNYLL
jgi:4-hydroxy-2-oxoheptanedioate aldolase